MAWTHYIYLRMRSYRLPLQPGYHSVAELSFWAGLGLRQGHRRGGLSDASVPVVIAQMGNFSPTPSSSIVFSSSELLIAILFLTKYL